MPTSLTPPLPPAVGTITITNGSATVAGTGTGFKALRVGDAIVSENGTVVIVDEKPTSNTSLAITKQFEGTTETDVAYTIVPRALYAQAAAYFELLNIALTSQEGQFVWLWNTATEAGDPGTGYVQTNNETWESATTLYISDTDQQSNDLGDWLATWESSKVVLTSLDRPSVFAFATLGTVTDSTGYRTIPLTGLVGSPDFNANERIVVAVLVAGPQGIQGIQGEIGDKYDLAIDEPSKPPSGLVIGRHIFAYSVTFAASFAGSRAVVVTNPTASAEFSIQKNDSEVGTLTIATDGTPTFAGAGATFADEDVLTVVSPNPRDDTLSGISMTLAGTRD